MEMSYAADVIAGRIAACSAGKIWLSPIVTGGEILTGKDCMTGSSLSIFERIIKGIPIVSKAEMVSNLDKFGDIIDTVSKITKVHNVYNSLEERQELIGFLNNEEKMELLKNNNPDLVPLVDNIDNTFDMSVHYQEVVEFLN